LRVVEVDGIYTEPAEASMLYLTAGQRYAVLLTVDSDSTTNIPFVASMDEVCRHFLGDTTLFDTCTGIIRRDPG